MGTVRPASAAGGSASLAGSTLTYSFSSTTVASGTAVSIQVNGLTNTGTAGGYTSTVTTLSGASAVDTATSSGVTFTARALSGPGWSVSSTSVGATNAGYTFTFTTATASLTITSVTMSVPPGTAGTPTLGSVTPSGLGGSVSLSGTTLTYSGISLLTLTPTAFSIEVDGLTNTSTAGTYTSEIVTRSGPSTPIDSGVTPAVSFTGPLKLTSPSALNWAAALTGTDQSAVDAVAADQRFSVDDETNSGAGWHITVSATTFTSGAHTLPDSGTLVLTGSLSSPTATTAPSSICMTSCTPPVSSTAYPVAITTGASTPTPLTVYDDPAGSGVGPATLGGASAAHPVGWWINIPANARAGSYTSTVTATVVSGP
ncbi:hypothetical protein DN069_09730 [Streptacidiphilus pinicola]|uniref:WxL domain-containing protein n=1 Tax=Streptacidiphilus pinicola TaxID=2219663 RepID=A0A2X0JDX2_9ACTN|nr:hypothetical protein [Streptacidiphilus pinicola]RAG85778.1 hypothetical protein DN069_09730 [Streptacidiphilus pinicola]